MKIKGIWFYSVKELKLRRKSEIFIFTCLAAMFCVIFNFTSYMHGVMSANLDLLESDYHIQLGYLDESDVAYIETLSYIKSMRTEKVNGIDYVYILLKDNSPVNIKQCCNDILNKIDAWNRIPYYQGYCDYYRQLGLPSGFTNQLYVDTASRNMVQEGLGFTFFVSLFSAVSIGMVMNVKIREKLKEYAVMKSFGMKNRNIMMINLIQLFICQTSAFLSACIFSSVVMKLFSVYTQIIFKNAEIDGARLVYFAVPFIDMLIAYVLIYAFSALILYFILKKYLKFSIVEILTGIRTYTVPFVSRSSRIFNRCIPSSAQAHKESKYKSNKNIISYGILYQVRHRYSLILQFLSISFLLVLPLLFLFISSLFIDYISYEPDSNTPHYRIYYTGNYFDNSGISDDVLYELTLISGIERCAVRTSDYDGSVSMVDIYIVSGMEDQVIQKLESNDILNNRTLYSNINFWESIPNSNKENAIVTVFMLFEGTLIFVSNTAVLYLFYKYYISTREYEMFYLSSLGLPYSKLKYILSGDGIWLIPSVAICVPMSFFVMFLLDTDAQIFSGNTLYSVIGACILICVYLIICIGIAAKEIKHIRSSNIAEGLAMKGMR